MLGVETRYPPLTLVTFAGIRSSFRPHKNWPLSKYALTGSLSSVILFSMSEAKGERAAEAGAAADAARRALVNEEPLARLLWLAVLVAHLGENLCPACTDRMKEFLRGAKLTNEK